MSYEKIETNLGEGRKNWCFIGKNLWREDDCGMIYPPKWSNPRHFRGYENMPDNYVEPMARVDCAFLNAQAFDDVDISVEYKSHIDSALSAGIIFRAQNSREFYILEIEDLFSGGAYYEMVLWKQEHSGYRYDIARGKAPHSFNSILGHFPASWTEWEAASPDWIDIRIQAIGTFIRVSVDNRILIDIRDATYSSGFAGLEARGAVCFKDLKVAGRPVSKTWTAFDEEAPEFFYPGGRQPYGYNACPSVCHTEKGVTVVCWVHGEAKEAGEIKYTCVSTISLDDGRIWSPPKEMFDDAGVRSSVVSLFEHKDGMISAVARVGVSYYVYSSADNGISWTDRKELLICGQPFDTDVHLYSPMIRLSDGTVVMTGYEAKHVPGGTPESDFDRKDRTILFFSDDDGRAWTRKTYIDENNFDHNECMLAETGEGRLVAFMRPLLAPNMWTSVSDDFGRTWSPLEQSEVRGSSSYLIKHSSGKVIMFSRGQEAYIRTTADGKTWTKQCRISPCNPMAGMTEMADGNIMIVMQEGFRVPAYIRGQVFSVTDGKVVPADTGIEKIEHDYEAY